MPGAYRIEVDLPGDASIEAEFTVREGETTVLTLRP